MEDNTDMNKIFKKTGDFYTNFYLIGKEEISGLSLNRKVRKNIENWSKKNKLIKKGLQIIDEFNSLSRGAILVKGGYKTGKTDLWAWTVKKLEAAGYLPVTYQVRSTGLSFSGNLLENALASQIARSLNIDIPESKKNEKDQKPSENLSIHIIMPLKYPGRWLFYLMTFTTDNFQSPI